MPQELQPAFAAVLISLILIVFGIGMGLLWSHLAHRPVRPTRWAAGACLLGILGAAYYVGRAEGTVTALLFLVFGATLPLAAFFLAE